jgi:hypothetical protein
MDEAILTDLERQLWEKRKRLLYYQSSARSVERDVKDLEAIIKNRQRWLHGPPPKDDYYPHCSNQ